MVDKFLENFGKIWAISRVPKTQKFPKGSKSTLIFDYGQFFISFNFGQFWLELVFCEFHVFLEKKIVFLNLHFELIVSILLYEKSAYKRFEADWRMRPEIRVILLF